ncbi:MAG: 4-hydroxy-3-methylbut-2-enyl diphosphate reductase [Treponema sp.]|jgi:4-hydroxy-3-methylbut-2-enyl diphosphate reductase|nr:4-hydroxy-3-methylbut-2-enyl diphosphate reductase [Treponema sp.]
MIEIARVCGFCAGAKTAFNGVLTAINDNYGRRVVLFKHLLHNQDAALALESEGAVTIKHREEFRPDDVIIVRAHGETREMFEYLDRGGYKYVNCTCQKVKRIHESVKEKSGAGYKIFIIGNKNNPEVAGYYSQCGDDAVVISSEKDIESINNLANEKIFVTVQTTFNRDAFCAFTEKIKQKFAACSVEIMDSLCSLTKEIQDASVELAAQCGTMIVIGDRFSANTQELYNKCKEVCPDTRRIEAKKQFSDVIINGEFDFDSKIGITGGASVPMAIIEDCKRLLAFKKFHERAKVKIMGKVKEYNKILLRDGNPLCQSVMEQFVMIGESEKAKFIRGSLLMLGYGIARGGGYDYSLGLAAAYEFFETSILVHDDVFDKAAKRRGVTTVHEEIGQKYLAGHEDREKLINSSAQSMAVCAGDWGFFFLNQMILDAYKDDRNLVPVLKYFNDTVIATIKGEIMDIALPLEEQLRVPGAKSIEEYVLQIDALKTSSYTTIGPFCLGLTLGGADRADFAKFEELFLYLGIAFQIKDDWLNIYGEHHGQGKPVGNDISEFKMTLLYSEVCKHEEWKERLLEFYGRENLTPEDVETVKDIFEKTGAEKNAQRVMKEYFEKCRALLTGISFKNEEDRDILLGFILFLELRSR